MIIMETHNPCKCLNKFIDILNVNLKSFNLFCNISMCNISQKSWQDPRFSIFEHQYFSFLPHTQPRKNWKIENVSIISFDFSLSYLRNITENICRLICCYTWKHLYPRNKCMMYEQTSSNSTCKTLKQALYEIHNNFLL